jgi:glutathione S-transferase
MARDPLGQAPTLITDQGAVLYDTRVICDYWNGAPSQHQSTRLLEISASRQSFSDF